MPVTYNPRVPIETFDVVVVDECHRSIYGVWRQVLDYFDAFIGLVTAFRDRQTRRLRWETLDEDAAYAAAAASVNVDFTPATPRQGPGCVAVAAREGQVERLAQ